MITLTQEEKIYIETVLSVKFNQAVTNSLTWVRLLKSLDSVANSEVRKAAAIRLLETSTKEENFISDLLAKLNQSDTPQLLMEDT